MGVKKIAKDWRTHDVSKTKTGLRTHTQFRNLEVTKSEDLPKLMTSREAAELLRRHVKTIEEYRKDGRLKFVKLGGRFFTTAEYIAEFLETESAK